MIKKLQAVAEPAPETKPDWTLQDFTIDYKAAARGAINRDQQELAKNKIEQKVKLELEYEEMQDQMNAFEATSVEEIKAPSSLNVISGQNFGWGPRITRCSL